MLFLFLKIFFAFFELVFLNDMLTDIGIRRDIIRSLWVDWQLCCGARAIILSALLDIFLGMTSRFERLACNSDALWACSIPRSLAQVSAQNLGRLLICFDLPLHCDFWEMWSYALCAPGFGSAEVLNGKVNFILLQRRGLYTVSLIW